MKIRHRSELKDLLDEDDSDSVEEAVILVEEGCQDTTEEQEEQGKEEECEVLMFVLNGNDFTEEFGDDLTKPV